MACSSVRKRVRVIMLVFTFSTSGEPLPFLVVRADIGTAMR